MALTVKELGRAHYGNRALDILVEVTFDSAYAAGGEAFDPKALFGLTELLAVPASVAYNDTGDTALLVSYDVAAKKLLAYEFNQDALADGPATENATANISAFKTIVHVIGY